MPLLSTFGAASARSFGGIGAVAAGAGLDIDEAFSTYLYTGNSSTQTITNGIDLAGEGGLVWTKSRSGTYNHVLVDTERGGSSVLFSNLTNSADTDTYLSFNSNGYDIDTSFAGWNNNTYTYASWTFRKAPKFFDVVTYTGNGTAGRTISHNLGSVPGMIIVKETSSATNWAVYHRSIGASNTLWLDLTNASSASSNWNSTAPTDSVFTVGSAGHMNGNGDTYVAYLFAHHDGDGEFGPDSDQDIIKCGSYTGDGTTDGSNSINLGFEPQWIMIKKTSEAANWNIYDNMRGVFTNSSSNIDDHFLFPNLSNAEDTQARIAFNPTGFQLESSNGEVNQSSATYIYMAIRRGPLAAPESASDVFDVETSTSATPRTWNSGFPVDLSIYCHRDTFATNKYVGTRLTGNSKYLVINGTSAEGSSSNLVEFDHSDKIIENNLGSTNSKVNWMWKRAPGYFDVVAYTGSGGASQSIDHNLGVVPEMIWVKDRGNASNWSIYHSTLGLSYVINFDTGVGGTGSQYWGTAAHTSSVFKVGSDTDTGASGRNYIAYLFATVAGVSKVGSVSHTNGTDTNVDCGFSSGARFILLKRTDGASSWYCWDTERGIVAGDDQVLYWQSTLAEQTGDSVDPLSSGFTMEGVFDTGTYIFYAIA